MPGRKKETAPPDRRQRRPGPPPLLARSGRFALVVFCVTGAFAGIGVRLWWLQYYVAPHLSDAADRARRYSRGFSADRGQIRDSRDTVLAKSREVWDIGADPFDFSAKNDENVDLIANTLSPLIKVPADKLAAIFRRKFRDPAAPADADDANDVDDTGADDKLGLTVPKARPIKWVKLAEGVSAEVRDKVVDRMKFLGVKAVYPSRRFEREYPQGKLASQLVGYVNKEGAPAMGIEKAFDFFLKGEDGWIDTELNGKKVEAPDRRIREITPRDGESVILTIDATIQQAAEEELTKACETYHPDWGIAIVSEAKTGRLLALTNWPTFDLNEYSDLKKSPLVAQKNRAVTDVYEPGSVFKIVSYSAAFQEGLITPNTMIRRGPDCSSPFLVPYKGKLYRLPKDDKESGWVDLVDVRKAIAKSSNRAAAQIGMLVAESAGEQKLWDYMSAFGFGAPTGLATGTEVKGTLHKPAQWEWGKDSATITRMPMGHSVDVTALQTHYAMGVIASGGDLMYPSLVSRVVDRDGHTVCDFPPYVRKHAIKREVAAQVADLLRGVVSKDGTGKNAIIAGYDVAGKTGTTAILVKNEESGKWSYSETRNVASFCGFFPAENPEIVISVIMRDPSGKGQSFGGTYSAPVFKAIAERVIKWRKIEPVHPEEADAILEKERRKSGQPPKKPAPAAFPFAAL